MKNNLSILDFLDIHQSDSILEFTNGEPVFREDCKLRNIRYIHKLNIINCKNANAAIINSSIKRNCFEDIRNLSSEKKYIYVKLNPLDNYIIDFIKRIICILYYFSKSKFNDIYLFNNKNEFRMSMLIPIFPKYYLYVTYKIATMRWINEIKFILKLLFFRDCFSMVIKCHR